MLRVRRPRRRDRAARAENTRTPDRHRQRRIRKAPCRRSDPGRAARRQRSRLAVLHLRHHRTAEGRDAHPQGAGGRERSLHGRGRYACARRSAAACRADEPRLRPLHDGLCHAPRRQRRAGIGRLRAGGNLRSVPRLAAHLDVCRSDHGQAAGRLRRGMSEREHPHHRLWRRADVCRGRGEGARPVRPAAGADLRAGRKPDDHHGAAQGRSRRPRSSALARAARLGRPAVPLHRGDGHGGRRKPACTSALVHARLRRAMRARPARSSAAATP